MDIGYLLKLMVEKNASDMFLSAGAPVYFKIEGKLQPVENTPLELGSVKKVAYSLMNEAQIAAFERDLEFNMAISATKIGRFRVNVFMQRGEVAMVIRTIRRTIPSLQELGLPGRLGNIVTSPRGLVLVVGATGSGKSTTLASMIDHRNRNMTGHILTIEHPIEYLHQHHKSLVNQREVGLDTRSFQNALRNAMREAPDVILIGEILDAATMEAAITFAETGHLCLATLHSNNADQTIERILNFFPESAHPNVLMNLSLNLRAVFSQRLIMGMHGKRIPATELLINTPMIADLLRRGQVHEIKPAMETSLEEGMEIFDQCLFRMVKERQISYDDALRASDSPEGLALKLRFSAGADEHDPYADFS
ncbi:MAG: PilT/PilU family type 4a pilus ATPase [Xanthomonadaceae bacterium]|nr:PilT/PilU family type 4a pilus ATPase [Xanthomonadaceae bacterium]